MQKMNFKFETELKEFLSSAIDEINSQYDTYTYDSFNGNLVEEIEYRSRDGFTAFTNGGFRIMLLSDLMSVFSSGRYFTDERINDSIRETIEYSLKCAYDDFISEYKGKLAEKFSQHELTECYENSNIHYQSLCENDLEDLAGILSEMEQSYLTENSEFWIELRVKYYSADNYRNKSGEDEIAILAGVNLDYGYGRDCGLEITFEENYPVSQITLEKLEKAIIEAVATI